MYKVCLSNCPLNNYMNPHRIALPALAREDSSSRGSFPMQWSVMTAEIRNWSEFREQRALNVQPHGEHFYCFQGSENFRKDCAESVRARGSQGVVWYWLLGMGWLLNSWTHSSFNYSWELTVRMGLSTSCHGMGRPQGTPHLPEDLYTDDVWGVRLLFPCHPATDKTHMLL